jgi:hypothetical protein
VLVLFGNMYRDQSKGSIARLAQKTAHTTLKIARESEIIRCAASRHASINSADSSEGAMIIASWPASMGVNDQLLSALTRSCVATSGR